VSNRAERAGSAGRAQVLPPSTTIVESVIQALSKLARKRATTAFLRRRSAATALRVKLLSEFTTVRAEGMRANHQLYP